MTRSLVFASFLAMGCSVVLPDLEPPHCLTNADCQVLNIERTDDDDSPDCLRYQCEAARCLLSGTDDDEDGHVAIECGGPDCNDADPSVHPSAPEICSAAAVDEDCDGEVEEADADGDGYTCGELDCNDDDPLVHPGAIDPCDDGGEDRDCDGVPEDVDGDGYLANSATCVGGPRDDCDDEDDTIYPADEAEVCNGRDDNCDMMPDATIADAMAGTTWCQAQYTRETGIVCNETMGLCCSESCPDDCNQRLCGAGAGTCVDVRTSTVHCGRCDNSCLPGARCLAGRCSVSRVVTEVTEGVFRLGDNGAGAPAGLDFRPAAVGYVSGTVYVVGESESDWFIGNDPDDGGARGGFLARLRAHDPLNPNWVTAFESVDGAHMRLREMAILNGAPYLVGQMLGRTDVVQPAPQTLESAARVAVLIKARNGRSQQRVWWHALGGDPSDGGGDEAQEVVAQGDSVHVAGIFRWDNADFEGDALPHGTHIFAAQISTSEPQQRRLALFRAAGAGGDESNTGNQSVQGLEVDSFGRVYIGGGFRGQITETLTGEVVLTQDETNTAGYLLAIEPGGTLRWAHEYDGPGGERVTAMAPEVDGVWAAGTVRATGSESELRAFGTAVGTSSAFVVLYGSGGAPVWRWLAPGVNGSPIRAMERARNEDGSLGPLVVTIELEANFTYQLGPTGSREETLGRGLHLLIIEADGARSYLRDAVQLTTEFGNNVLRVNDMHVEEDEIFIVGHYVGDRALAGVPLGWNGAFGAAGFLARLRF